MSDKTFILPEIKKIVSVVDRENKKGHLPSLYIIGPEKSGKTFLLRRLSVFYKSTIFDIASVSNPTLEELKKFIAVNRSLIIDNFQYIKPSSINILKLILFYIKGKRPIVISSTLPLTKVNIPKTLAIQLKYLTPVKLLGVSPERIISLLEEESKKNNRLFIKEKAQIFAQKGSIDGFYEWMETNFPLKGKQKIDSSADLISSLVEEIKGDVISSTVDEKREEFMERIYIWEVKGFNVEPLKKIIGGEIHELEKAFNDYVDRVSKLMELHKRFGMINYKFFPKERVNKIESDLFDPYKVEEIEKEIEQFEKEYKLMKEIMKDENDTYSEFNYIIQQSNQESYLMIEYLLNNGKLKYNPLMVVGDSGTGKTHFLHFIVYRWRKIMGNYRSVYIPYERLYSILKEGIDISNLFDVFCVDDLDEFIKRYGKNMKSELPSFFSKLLSMNKQVVVTVSNQAILSLVNIEHFFPSSNIVIMDEPDSSIRRGVIGRLCREMGINMTSESMDYLATTSQVPLSEMYDVITRIAKESSDKKEIDVHTIETILNTGLISLTGDIGYGMFSVDVSMLIEDWDDNRERIYME